MSLFGSLFAGVSGLFAQSQSMSMISDNVSNVNTVSYKGAEAQFSTLVTRSAGVETYSPAARASTHYRIDKQGLIQASSSATDVAIQGSGFFVVNGLPDGSDEQLYTRAGSFEQDFLGNLRNSAGFFLAGLGARRQRGRHQRQPTDHGQCAGHPGDRRADHGDEARRQSRRHPGRLCRRVRGR